MATGHVSQEKDITEERRRSWLLYKERTRHGLSGWNTEDRSPYDWLSAKQQFFTSPYADKGTSFKDGNSLDIPEADESIVKGYI